MFISVEGGEGAGKSSALLEVMRMLQERGIGYTETREPGGNRISTKIRNVILNPEHTDMVPMTELLLYMAARAQNVETVIRPACERGGWVLADRYVDSSVVYQGMVRGLGKERVEVLNGYATGGLLPDLTLWFDVEPEVGLNRILGADQREYNRLDREALEFHKQVHAGYRQLCAENPERIVRIDANGTIAETLAQVREVLMVYL